MRRQSQLEALVVTSKERMEDLKTTVDQKRNEVKVQEQIRINLEERLQKLEEEALRVPQAPPPPPPPQKSFLFSLAKPFKVRGRKTSKQEQKTQAKGTESSGTSTMLNAQIVEAIRQRSYSLRPVEDSVVKRRIARKSQQSLIWRQERFHQGL